MATIKEIAEKSGFSPATVSRLLNNDSKLSVTPETKSKILKVATELGYFKSQNKKIRNVIPEIALLYRVNGKEHLEDEYFSFLKQRVKEVVQEEKINCTVFTDAQALIAESHLYQGFLGVGTGELTEDLLKQLYQVLPAGVFIDINPAPYLFDSVQPNLALTVQNAIDRLLDQGYNFLAYIGAESFTLDKQPQRDVREITFNEYCKIRKVTKTAVFANGIVSVENGYALAQNLVKKCGKTLPEALIVSSDTLSVGVLQYFNEVGIRVPQDIAMISINNSEVAKYVSPPLTSYNIDQKALSKLAISILKMRILDPTLPTLHLTVNTNLVIRKSFK